MVGASSYDAFMIIIEGIKQSGSTDAQAIRDAIANLKDYHGVTGMVRSFNALAKSRNRCRSRLSKTANSSSLAKSTTRKSLRRRLSNHKDFIYKGLKTLFCNVSNRTELFVHCVTNHKGTKTQRTSGKSMKEHLCAFVPLW